MAFNQRLHIVLLKITILGLFLFNIIFLGRGALSFPDENRYIRSYQGLELFINGDFSGGLKEIIINAGNPGFQIYCLVPTSIQWLYEKFFDQNHLSVKSLLIPQIFNLIVLALTIYLFYSVFRLYINQFHSLFASALILLSFSSTVYLRHLLPYDLSILIFSFIIFKLFKANELSTELLVYLGFLSSVLFSIYTGFFFLIFILYALLLLKAKKKKVTTTLYYFSGFAPLIIFFEIIGRYAGTSYIYSLINHSSTISQGDYIEGFSFPWLYLYNIDGFTGISFMVFSITFLIVKLRQNIISKKKADSLDQLIIISLFVLFMYCFQCYFLKKLVWYGRIFHFFVPIIIISTVKLFIELKIKDRTILCFGILSLLFVAPNYAEYQKVRYPRDIVEEYNINLKLKKNFIFSLHGGLIMFPFNKSKSTKAYQVSNLGFLWPEKNDISNPAIRSLSAEKEFSHYLNIKPYQFEGFNSMQRKILRKEQIFIQIFEKGQKEKFKEVYYKINDEKE